MFCRHPLFLRFKTFKDVQLHCSSLPPKHRNCAPTGALGEAEMPAKRVSLLEEQDTGAWPEMAQTARRVLGGPRWGAPGRLLSSV